jgi:hypothetical protein
VGAFGIYFYSCGAPGARCTGGGGAILMAMGVSGKVCVSGKLFSHLRTVFCFTFFLLASFTLVRYRDAVARRLTRVHSLAVTAYQ